MSGCSRLTRRRFRRDPTHALFADQSHSFPDNLEALLGQIRAWNYSAGPARSAGSLFASQLVRKLEIYPVRDRSALTLGTGSEGPLIPHSGGSSSWRWRSLVRRRTNPLAGGEHASAVGAISFEVKRSSG